MPAGNRPPEPGGLGNDSQATDIHLVRSDLPQPPVGSPLFRSKNIGLIVLP
jgi:hypothetical protein